MAGVIRSTIGRGEADALLDPGEQLGGLRRPLGEVAHEPGEHAAVVGQEVAAHDGDRGSVRAPAHVEPERQLPDHGRRPAAAEVGRDPRVVEAKPAADDVVAIGLVGDVEGDHLHPRVGDPPQQAGGIGLRESQLADGADDPQALAAGTTLSQRVEPVLRRKLLDDRGTALCHPADPPVTAGGDDRVLGVRRLMGTMECSDPQVHDPDVQLAGVDRGPQRCRHGVERRQRQPAHITAPSCQGTNSSSPKPSSSLLVGRPEATARIS